VWQAHSFQLGLMYQDAYNFSPLSPSCLQGSKAMCDLQQLKMCAREPGFRLMSMTGLQANFSISLISRAFSLYHLYFCSVVDEMSS
jgi:hypothetical protein